MLSINNQRHRQ